MTRSIVFQLGTVRLEVWISLGALVVLLGGAVQAGAGEQLPSSEADAAATFPLKSTSMLPRRSARCGRSGGSSATTSPTTLI